MAACVVSTVLKHKQIRPHARARVIQRWIDIAQVGRGTHISWYRENTREAVTDLYFLLTGVSDTQKLLISASHCVRAAVQSSVQAEKSMGLCAQVSLQLLRYADNLSGFSMEELAIWQNPSTSPQSLILHTYFSRCAQYHSLTWICPPHRDSMQTFEELSDIFSDHNNYLTSRELLMRVSSNITSYFICDGNYYLLKKNKIPVWKCRYCFHSLET